MINRIKTQIKINKARKESKKLDKEIAEQNVEIKETLKRINQQEKLMKKQKAGILEIINILDSIITETTNETKIVKNQKTIKQEINNTFEKIRELNAKICEKRQERLYTNTYERAIQITEEIKSLKQQLKKERNHLITLNHSLVKL